jgi:hypothetical protein
LTRIMRDSSTPTDIPLHGTDLVAGYVTGRYTWPAKAYARFRGIPLAHIDCRGTKPEKAEILDVEPRCTDVHAAVSWVKKRKAAFPGAYPPIIYCNRDTLTPLHHAMNAAGLHVVKDFRLWVATLDGTKKPQSMTGVMAVQYAGEGITGGHYDESIVYDDDWHPEDDMPYTRRDIVGMVKEGVAKELGAETIQKEIRRLVRQAVADELQTVIGPSPDTTLSGIANQLTLLNNLLEPDRSIPGVTGTEAIPPSRAPAAP